MIVFVILAFVSPPFLRTQNLTNILDQQAGIIILACAGTFVLIAGGIDLSIGAIYGLAGAIALNTATTFSSPVGVVAGLAVGLAVGLINGLVVTRFRINPLIGTLAMSFVVAGIAAIVTKGNLVVAFDHPDFQQFAATRVVGHHERGLDDDRDRDRGDGPAQPNDLRSVRVRHRRERPGGAPRGRAGQCDPRRRRSP